jgi:tetratricopeptide (TPR) repeat protein
MVTLAVDHWLGNGLDPFYFHLSTFLWFLLQGALMFVLYRRILNRALDHGWNSLAALLIAGWYCLHTANAETINYVSARSDSLSTLCVILGLVIHTQAKSWTKHLAIAPVLVGILIKATAVMYFPLVLAYELLFVHQLSLPEWFARRNWRVVGRALLEIIPAAALSIALFLFTLHMTPKTWNPGGVSTWSYLITQPFVIARYVWLLFLPTPLSADTDWHALAGIADWRFAVGSLVLIALTAITFISSKTRSHRPIAFGILWFFITLVPSSSFVALAEVTNDHRIFYPYVGLCLAVGWAATLLLMKFEADLARSRGLKIAVGAAIVAVLGGHAYGTYQRSEVWGSNETLWHDVVTKSPENGRGQMNYGLALMRRGDYETALLYFDNARETRYGKHPYLQLNNAIVKASLGRSEAEIEAHYHRALQTEPNDPACHYWYAKWLVDEGRIDEARSRLERSLELGPGHAGATQLLSTLTRDHPSHQSTGRDPETADEWLQRSFEHYSAGRYYDCIAAAQEALRLAPDFAPAYNNICSAYNAQKNWDEGIAACDRALEIAPDYALAQNNRTWAINEKAALEAAQTE